MNMNDKPSEYSRRKGRDFTTLSWAPLAIVHDDEKTWSVQIGLPDAIAETLQAILEEGALVISGSVRRANKNESERGALPFVRMFDLPINVDRANGVAEISSNVLTVSFGKTAKTPPVKLDVRMR